MATPLHYHQPLGKRGHTMSTKKQAAKHTPGPWKVAPSPCKVAPGIYEIHWSEIGECVAEIVHGEADARLIAAAPELLEAAKLVIDGTSTPHVEKLRAAIAKATEGT